MTCVIGLVDGSDVWMGTDSVTTRDHGLLMTSRLGKVFTRGQMLFGSAGSPRHNQLMRYVLEIPSHDPDMSTDEYIISKFVESLRICFSENGFTTYENGQELGGHALIAYKGRLYEIGCEYALEPQEITAIGCGSHFAMGALAALSHLSPPDRLTRVLSIVSELDPYVGPPFVIWKLGEDKPWAPPTKVMDFKLDTVTHNRSA